MIFISVSTTMKLSEILLITVWSATGVILKRLNLNIPSRYRPSVEEKAIGDA